MTLEPHLYGALAGDAKSRCAATAKSTFGKM